MGPRGTGADAAVVCAGSDIVCEWLLSVTLTGLGILRMFKGRLWTVKVLDLLECWGCWRGKLQGKLRISLLASRGLPPVSGWLLRR
ncbi:hypothetical protein GCM10007170_28390 [Arthrobacter liuii]|uniref:Uncharacterized protein n=1 Tax=Arthrobacter liuii TaxID=1476996 RepID=A0ABQ2AXZ9_9MICC|nr:hypothetical protein GCM10007170_28390 [Arthrobacter liuii]